MGVLVVAEAIAIALLGLLVLSLLRSHGDVLRALHDAGIYLDPDAAPSGRSPSRRLPSARPVGSGTAGHDLAGVDSHGGALSLDLGESSGTTLLAFLSSGCLTCAEFWQAFGRPESLRLPAGIRLVIVTKGTEHESASRVATLAPAAFPVIMSSQAWLDYEIQVAPYFVLVEGGHGIVGEGASSSWQQVVDLLDGALRDAEAARNPAGSMTTAAAADQALWAAGIDPDDEALRPTPDPGATET